MSTYRLHFSWVIPHVDVRVLESLVHRDSLGRVYYQHLGQQVSGLTCWKDNRRKRKSSSFYALNQRVPPLEWLLSCVVDCPASENKILLKLFVGEITELEVETVKKSEVHLYYKICFI